MRDLSFPPLMSGLALSGAAAPFDTAVAMAARGCDAGIVVHNVTDRALRAALVLAPEVPLRRAMAMLPACGLGLQNALGALAPPEVAVQLDWAGGLRVNGARCGRLRVAAGGRDPEALPGWLVVGLELPLWSATDRPGDHPDDTALFEEGCAGVDPHACWRPGRGTRWSGSPAGRRRARPRSMPIGAASPGAWARP